MRHHSLRQGSIVYEHCVIIATRIFSRAGIAMHDKELKTCAKCGEHYFGDACVGCHSNQYASYTSDTSTKNKILILTAFVVIVTLIILQK